MNILLAPSLAPLLSSFHPYSPSQNSFIRNACAQKLGFSNAELLQDTDWSKVALNPRIAAPKLPKWVWSHDPEAYAYANFERAEKSEREGVSMRDESGFEPNYPKGYRYVFAS